MFDHHFHIHSKHHPRRKHLRYMRFVSVMLGTVGIGLSAYAIGFVVFFGSAPVSIARDINVTVSLRESRTSLAVAPLDDYPLAELSVMVSGRTVFLSELSFTLGGFYSPTDVSSLRVIVDGAQVGMPVLPDEYGIVHATFETVRLAPGEHKVLLALESNTTAAVFRADFVPQTALTFVDAAGNTVSSTFLASTQEHLIRAASHGTLGSFIQESSQANSPTAPRVSLYAEGEALHIESLELQSSADLTGERFDIFIDDTFVTAASFAGKQAVATIGSDLLIVPEGRNVHLVFVPIGGLAAEGFDADVFLQNVTVQGEHSGVRWQETLVLPIFNR